VLSCFRRNDWTSSTSACAYQSGPVVYVTCPVKYFRTTLIKKKEREKINYWRARSVLVLSSVGGFQIVYNARKKFKNWYLFLTIHVNWRIGIVQSQIMAMTFIIISLTHVV
jgi:hypothetical protein